MENRLKCLSSKLKAALFGSLTAIFAFGAMGAGLAMADSQQTEEKISGLLYVAMGPAGAISVIDLSTNKLVKKFKVNADAHGLAISGDGKYLYVPSLTKIDTDKVAVIDTRTGDVVAEVRVGARMHHATTSPDGRYIYVAIGSTKEVAIIDSETNQVVSSIKELTEPEYVVFSRDGKKGYISEKGYDPMLSDKVSPLDVPRSDKVSVFDVESKKVIAKIKVGQAPDHMALTPDGKYLFVVNNASDSVAIIDTVRDHAVATINVGLDPHAVDISPDGKYAFVTNRGADSYSVIDVTSMKELRKVTVGKGPDHVNVIKEGGNYYLYMGILSQGAIQKLEPLSGEVISTIEVGGEPHAALQSPRRDIRRRGC